MSQGLNHHSFPGGSAVKNLPASAGDLLLGKIPLQSSCLGNPTGRGAWWTAVHGVTKESDTT